MSFRLRRADLGEESGATMLVVAVSLLALLGMVVLVVDLGGMLVMRRRLVNAADSAALAAAESCAMGAGAGEAGAQADRFAKLNVGGAVRDELLVISPSCDSAPGTAKVKYSAQQPLYFAPILGFGEEAKIAAGATATWSPAGNAKPVPIYLNLDWLQTQCDIPSPTIGTKCYFWWNNQDLGSSQWGYMNLDQWDVTPGYSCSNSGSSVRSDYIHNDYPEYLLLNGSPPGSEPTYVCSDSGHSSRDWADLEEELGTIKTFPVNDPSAQIPPVPESPDYLSIVGFSSLLLEDMMRGDDPEASGTPGAAGTCSETHSFTTLPPGNVLLLDTLGCSTAGMVDLKLSKTTPEGETIYQENVDYTFDPLLHLLTWERAEDVPDVKIEWAWGVSGTPGKCGLHDPDPNAICLVVEWKGFQTGGIAGGGMDLGLRVIRLSE